MWNYYCFRQKSRAELLLSFQDVVDYVHSYPQGDALG